VYEHWKVELEKQVSGVGCQEKAGFGWLSRFHY
jgi:hypothetical protein